MKEFRVPKSSCPHCGYAMDCATPLVPGSEPDEDCFSLCIGCGELSLFDPDLKLRAIEPEDLLPLTEEERRYLLRLQEKTKRFLRERKAAG